MSSSEALNSPQWIPLAGGCFTLQCSAVQNAIEGEVPEHLETLKITLRNLHGHNTRNSYLPRISKPENLMEKKTTLCDGSFLCKDYFISSSSIIIMHLLLGRN